MMFIIMLLLYCYDMNIVNTCAAYSMSILDVPKIEMMIMRRRRRSRVATMIGIWKVRDGD